jgi:hypothetical protein
MMLRNSDNRIIVSRLEVIKLSPELAAFSINVPIAGNANIIILAISPLIAMLDFHLYLSSFVTSNRV